MNVNVAPNGRQLVENQIVTNVSDLERQIQQIGVDLTVNRIHRVVNNNDHPPLILKDSTILPRLQEVFPEDVGLSDEHPRSSNGPVLPEPGWILSPGTYHISLNEGCNVPVNLWLEIRQRSSLLRCGTTLVSSVFDPGFSTQFIGTVFVVHNPIFIARNARVGQMIAHCVSCVEDRDLYGNENKGSQFQGK